MSASCTCENAKGRPARGEAVVVGTGLVELDTDGVDVAVVALPRSTVDPLQPAMAIAEAKAARFETVRRRTTGRVCGNGIVNRGGVDESTSIVVHRNPPIRHWW